MSSKIDGFLQIMARNFTILIKRFRDCVRTYTYYHNLTISSLFTVRRDPSNSLPTALQVCVYLVDFWPLEFTGFFLKRLFLDEALQECGVDQIYEDCKFCTLNIHSSLSFCSFSFDIIPFQFQNVASTFSQSYISQVLWTLYCGTQLCAVKC